MTCANQYEDIGRRLIAFRQHLGMTPTEFARTMGYNYTRYLNWESGARRIPPDQAMLLEERYGLSLDFIYIGKLHTLPHKLATALAGIPADKR